MKNSSFRPLVILFVGVLALLNFSSCSEETPEPSENVGKIIFWQSKANAEANDFWGITSYKFYVAGDLVGSMSADVYWNVAPDCDNTGAVNVKWQLGERESQTVTYEIKDQAGVVAYSGSIKVVKGECTQFEMTP